MQFQGIEVHGGLNGYAGVRARTPAFGLVGIRMGIIGIWLQTWTRVIVNRCISKIIARDLSLMVTNHIERPLPGPGSRVAVT